MSTSSSRGRATTASPHFPGWRRSPSSSSGVSKSFSWTGGRVGWALFPTVEEAEVFRNLNINYFSCVPAYNQEGARLGVESPLAAPAIRTMVEAFQERRDLIVDGLAPHSRDPLPEAQGCVLRFSECQWRLLLPRNHGRLPEPSPGTAGKDDTVDAPADVPPLRVPGGHNGPQVFRKDRSGESPFPADLRCHGQGIPQAGG